MKLRDALERALAARRHIVAKASNARLATALSNAAEKWRSGTYEPRRSVTEHLARHLAMNPDMLARGLDHLFGSIDESSIGELLAEAEEPIALESAMSCADGARQRLLGPPVVFYALAGNVPGLAIPAIVACVLARSVAIVRDSVRQPWLTEAFLATLAEYDTDAATMIVPASWEAGDLEREREALAVAGRAELYGADRTVREIRARHEPAPVEIIERGTRLSVGFFVEHADVDRHACGFAEDIVLYEGLGCLSPPAILVEGSLGDAGHFAERLAEELARFEQLWPRQAQRFELEATRRAFLDRSEALALARRGDRLIRGRGDAWVVHMTDDVALEIGPGLRSVRVIACREREQALTVLAHAPAPLAAVGLACDEGEDHIILERALRELGATLVCEPGRMQAPPLRWQQDGRRRLGDLLSWQRVEA